MSQVPPTRPVRSVAVSPSRGVETDPERSSAAKGTNGTEAPVERLAATIRARYDKSTPGWYPTEGALAAAILADTELLDALVADRHAETLGYLGHAYEVIERDRVGYERLLRALWNSRRYWQQLARARWDAAAHLVVSEEHGNRFDGVFFDDPDHARTAQGIASGYARPGEKFAIYALTEENPNA